MQVTSQELEIVRLFRDKVYGKRADTSLSNHAHDGKGGHWLEKQMGIAHNSNTEADLLGYEMKNGTRSKISFGDWMADYYIHNDTHFVSQMLYSTKTERRNNFFIKVFGSPNPEKNNRYSWSGKPVPKINKFNDYGQILIVENKDVVIKYSYEEGQREDKESIIPENMRHQNLVIAKWFEDSLRKKINNKFNKKGWFICKKDTNEIYNEIVFGNPLSLEDWLDFVKDGTVFLDSGMKEDSSRNYSQWRANNVTFDKLVARSYPPFP